MNLNVVNLKNVVNLTQLITPRVESHELWVLPSSTFHVDPLFSSKFPRTGAPMCKNEPPSLNLRRFPQRKDESEEKGEAPAAEKDLYDALAPGFDGSLFLPLSSFLVFDWFSRASAELQTALASSSSRIHEPKNPKNKPGETLRSRVFYSSADFKFHWIRDSEILKSTAQSCGAGRTTAIFGMEFLNIFLM